VVQIIDIGVFGQGQRQFEVRWHPFQLNPDAPQTGINKLEYYKQKFGEQRVRTMLPAMTVRLLQGMSSIEARYALRVEYAHRILQCSTACGGFGL
jgi:predicted DsbA family dithiol-disulfide isomerase